MDKQVWEYKRDCHALLEKIWGNDKQGRTQAYLWLEREFGQVIHFSQINDPVFLKTINDRLFSHWVLSENKMMIDSLFKEERRKAKRHDKLNRLKKGVMSRNYRGNLTHHARRQS